MYRYQGKFSDFCSFKAAATNEFDFGFVFNLLK